MNRIKSCKWLFFDIIFASINHKKKKKMEQKNGWFAFWQKLMKCLSKQDETGVGDTKSVAPVNTIIQSIKGVSSSKEKDSSKVKSLTESVDTFLKSRYDFRYNVLTEETEYRLLERMEEGFAPVSQRVLNTFCLEAHESGISCWDRDLSRCIFSTRIAEYHPFKLYLEELPVWLGGFGTQSFERPIVGERIPYMDAGYDSTMDGGYGKSCQ
jgi:hypothetical protein